MRKASYKKLEIYAKNDIFEAHSIERMIEKAETAQQPIDETAPIIYTERKDGVLPQYDIRSDRWELAQAAMDKVAASYQAKRADWIKANTENQESAEVSA